MDTKPINDRPAPIVTRRAWLATLAASGLGLLGADKVAPAHLEPDPVELAFLLEQAKKAGLGAFRTSQSEHFVGIGDAPDDHRNSALTVCESIYKTFRNHFQTVKKIELTPPAHKLAVVILADKASYDQFNGEGIDAEYGHYDVEVNCLVTYRFNENDRQAATYNTFTLVHEEAHQLTYNLGLLPRKADVPVAVSEGFATYCEMWRVSRPVMGKVNAPWLEVLKQGAATDWLPLPRLIEEDGLFSDAKTNQMAYAEAWLLVYDLLQTRAGTAALKQYLAALKAQRDRAGRIACAAKALGDLDRLDRELKGALRGLSRGPG
jgi:hypothetical protein